MAASQKIILTKKRKLPQDFSWFRMPIRTSLGGLSDHQDESSARKRCREVVCAHLLRLSNCCERCARARNQILANQQEHLVCASSRSCFERLSRISKGVLFLRCFHPMCLLPSEGILFGTHEEHVSPAHRLHTACTPPAHRQRMSFQ